MVTVPRLQILQEEYILMKYGILRFVNVIWIPAERLPE